MRPRRRSRGERAYERARAWLMRSFNEAAATKPRREPPAASAPARRLCCFNEAAATKPRRAVAAVVGRDESARRFNEAAATKPRRGRAILIVLLDCWIASMRPRRRSRGEPPAGPTPTAGRTRASMRPRRRSRGELAIRVSAVCGSGRASMRPRRRSRGEAAVQARSRRPPRGFNEAAATKPRRERKAARSNWVAMAHASMRPRRRSRGEVDTDGPWASRCRSRFNEAAATKPRRETSDTYTVDSQSNMLQ